MRTHRLLFVAVVGCGGGGGAPVADAAPPPVDADPATAIVPGERVGALRLDMRWSDVLAALGPPPVEPVVLVRLGHAAWPALGLEAVFTSPSETTLTDDALVIGAGATAAMAFTGPALPGDARAVVEGVLGIAPEQYGGRDYYPAGLAVEYGAGSTVLRVGVVAAYTLAPSPPPMGPAAASSP